MSIPVAAQYIKDFEQLGFGLFVHWGLYSTLGKGEWIYHFTDLKMSEYEKLADTFTAEDFDAEKLVLTAKNAGCRYITLTTRHHDGFSLFDTCGLSDFDVMHTPAKRDLIREFVDACNRHGMVPFFYHTTLDWHNPDFENDFDAYLEYLRKSVELLCTHYGKIGGVWFDGNWSKPDADWKEDELYKTIRKHQPEAMIINNTGLSKRGEVGNPEIDSVTFEQGTPTPMNREGMPKYLAGEMAQTINDHWGIGRYDINYKSPKTLIESLCNSRKVGANYLLNIGPLAQGSIDPFQEQLLHLIGIWMESYGEAIYNGRPYPATAVGKNFILKSVHGDALYIFAFDLGSVGDENITLGGNYAGYYAFGNVTDTIHRIEWMDDGDSLTFIQGSNMLSVDLKGYHYGKSMCVRVAKAYLK